MRMRRQASQLQQKPVLKMFLMKRMIRKFWIRIIPKEITKALNILKSEPPIEMKSNKSGIIHSTVWKTTNLNVIMYIMLI